MYLLTGGLNDSSIKIMCGIPKEIKSEKSASSYLLTSPRQHHRVRVLDYATEHQASPKVWILCLLDQAFDVCIQDIKLC